jgi:hypothetical protein
MANTMSNHHFDWFKLADYQALKRFKLSDWSKMISRRNKWEIELSWYHLLKAEENTKRWPDDLWDPAKVEEDRKRFLDDYLADVLPCNHGARGPEWWPTTTSIRIPAITDITDCFREVGDFEIKATGSRLLMVDTRAPDTVLNKTSISGWWRNGNDCRCQ